MSGSYKGVIKVFLDFIPVVLFFVSYKFSQNWFKPVVFASLVLTIATVVSMIISKILRIKLDKFAFYTNLVVVLFGILTVVFDNPNFIKAKLTIINLILSGLMMSFFFLKKPVIKTLFKDKIEMDDAKWNILNLRFAVAFLLIAVLNFYFWHFTEEVTWVNFKTFGVLPIMILFIGLQMRFIMKNGKSLHSA